MKLMILLLVVSHLVPSFKPIPPVSNPTNTSIAKYFTGTRPMNMINMHVANNNTAEEKFESAMSPQMLPHQNKIGINDSLMSSIFCCRFESMLAKLMMSAKLAKSDG